MQNILIVVDMQNDFIDGALGTKEAAAIVPKVEEKIRNFDGKVFFTRDTHETYYLETQEGKKLPVIHCIKGTDGWQIIPELEVEGCEYIDKPTFGWLNWGGLGEHDEIELVGVCTDICVVSNALILKAMYPEAVISVDAGCCAGVTPEKHEAALETMKSCQIDVWGE